MYMYWPCARYGKHPLPTKNFGDALNPYIGHFFSGETVKNVNTIEDTVPKDADVFLVCGSNLAYATMPTIVWGSAILSTRIKFNYKPVRIHAVRGPMTRRILLNKKIPCPPVYGDPGLLCPMMFATDTTKKYKLGIIPHVVDKKEYLSWGIRREVKFIDIEAPFQQVVDEVNMCENIVSSSLHGLILADAYHIPSLWAVIGGKPTQKGRGFKFHDYYKSVGMKPYKPILLTGEQVHKYKTLAKKCKDVDIQIDLEKLVGVCPFNKKGRKWNP